MATAKQCPKKKLFEPSWTVEEIDISRLFVDHIYQRPLTGYEDYIVANFDSDLLLPLCVSERDTSTDECYAVIDGQTRLAALRAIEHRGTVHCVTYRNLHLYEEAGLFEDFQMKRKNMTQYDRFKAGLIRRCKQTTAINSIVMDAGYAIVPSSAPKKPEHIRAIAAVKLIFGTNTKIKGTYANDDLLRETLNFCSEVWMAHHGTIDAHILQGVARFLSVHPTGTYDRGRMIAKLATVGHDGIRFRAVTAKNVGLLGRHGRVVAHYKTILDIYNEGEKAKLRQRL